jgi:hypothetical protein
MGFKWRSEASFLAMNLRSSARVKGASITRGPARGELYPAFISLAARDLSRSPPTTPRTVLPGGS